MAKKRKNRNFQVRKDLDLGNPNQIESTSEGMSSVTLRRADGTIVKPGIRTKTAAEIQEDIAWYSAFVDPDEGDISIHSLGVATGTKWHPDNAKKPKNEEETS